MKTLTHNTLKKITASLGLFLIGAVLFANSDSKMLSHNSGEFTVEIYIIEDVESVELENWMTKPSGWNANLNTILEIDVEESLQFEEWMINPDNMNRAFDMETEMELEDWMTEIDNTDWATESSIEEDNTLESWMLNPSDWLAE